MFMAQCFRFGWRRCSPLNWALAIFSTLGTKSNVLSKNTNLLSAFGILSMSFSMRASISMEAVRILGFVKSAREKLNIQ
ncbi:hypothetical protein ELS82_23945, partial [Vibrio ouci]